jgi:hypothetical protein
MTGKLFGPALGCLLLACGGALADDPAAPGAALVPAQAPAPPQLPPPGEPRQPPPAAPDQLAAALRPPAESPEVLAVTNPHMMGDFPAIYLLRPFLVPAVQIVSTSQTVTRTTQERVTIFVDGKLVTVLVPVTTTFQVPVQRQTIVEVPVNIREPFPFRGAFKVADNESPRPTDRVFFNYNFYDSVTGGGASLPRFDTVSTTIGGNPALVTTIVPGVPAPRIDVHREIAGFEKTFLDGDASVGLRAPVVEQAGAGAVGGSDFGDVTVVLKYAFLNDRATGDVLSGGLAVTVPTGPGVPLQTGDLHSTLLQPWVGYARNFDRFYVQGFTSLVVPTDRLDATLLCNDVGAGYALYRSAADRLVSAVVPALEAHVTTPLNHRDETSPIAVPDLVVLTAGSHFSLYDRGLLSVGVAVPVTGPRAFDVEALVQLNWRF